MMTEKDTYRTIFSISEGYYTEKRSRFISYAIPVKSVEEVKEYIAKYQNFRMCFIIFLLYNSV